MIETRRDDACRHVLSLSGGKDSTALALYMRDKVQEMEYVFCDTGEELRETYEYLTRLESHLGTSIVVLRHEDRMGFKDLLRIRNGFLPSPQVRWCTELLKIRPFEKYIADDQVINYVGIRADESHRKGYISTKPNITTRFPFVEDGVTKEQVFRILEDSGLGLPSYYTWRSRSGCYFCFFQQRREWVGLLETHPDLFEKAMQYEREDPETGERFTWVQGESLAELRRPERVAQIKKEYQTRLAKEARHRPNQPLSSLFAEGSDTGCTICHL